LSRSALWLAAVSLCGAANPAEVPVQPIPFSHKVHATAAHLKCEDCHKLPDPGEVETLPRAKECLTCHASVKADNSDIRALKAYAEERRPVPWIRVYELPGFVYFSHKVHLEGGASCPICHGPVEQRDRLWRETDLSMQACVNCHTTNKAPVGCGICHELQR
jgi:Zn ribbon nucleic-acid-binding protein